MVKFVLPSLLLVAAFAPSAAWAKDDAAEAKAEFETATRYFEAEEYEVALTHFQKAYQLSNKRPAAIFGLAQCLRILKRYEESIRYFEEYVATDPEDADRAKETIVMLREAKRNRDEANQKEAAKAAPKPAPPEPTAAAAPPPPPSAPKPTDQATLVAPPPEDDGSIIESPWFWIVTGAVVIGGGVALGVALGSGGSPYGGNSGVVLEP